MTGDALSIPTRPVDEEALKAGVFRREVAEERRDEMLTRGAQVLLLAFLLGGWAWASGRILDALFVSNPIAVLRAFRDLAGSEQFWQHMQVTGVEVLAGYALGTGAGITMAALLSLVGGLEEVLRPFLIGFYSIPKIALAPLFIMWFGLDIAPKIILATLFVFFIVLVNALAGFRAVSPDLLNLVRVMGASRGAIFRAIVLPSAAPFIVTALRISVPEAVTGAVIGEFIAANKGMGYLINASSSQFNTPAVFAGIAGLLGIVLVLGLGVSALERALLRWQPKGQKLGARVT